jgi:2-dehydropantoate 2-reductase
VTFVVLGAGAIGATVGGLLAEAGHPVTLLARGEHAARLQHDGLRLERPDRALTLHPPVVTSAADLELADGDVLLLATKSQHTADLLTAAGAARGADGATVVCLQNGIANEQMALRRFARVVGCCVFLPATLVEPGVVSAEAMPMPGVLTLGIPAGSAAPEDQLHGIAAALESAGFIVPVVDDVMAWKRTKLLSNLNNVLDALTSEHDDERIERISKAARNEAEAAFTAAGCAWVGEAEWTAARHGLRVEPVAGRPRDGSSSWQSLARGGSLETDYLNGEIALLARLHGTDAPVNAALQRAAAVAVGRGDAPGSWSAARLAEAVDLA